MGCDIHRVFQVKTNEWINVSSEVFNGRNYISFGLLADVRNYRNDQPIIDPDRGLPRDFDIEKHDNDIYLGNHSFGYVSLKELENYVYRCCMLDEEWFLHSTVYTELMLAMIEMKNRHKVTSSDVRMVFGFDS